MSPTSCALTALAGVSLLLALACQEAEDPQFTRVPTMTFEPSPDPPVVTRRDAAGAADAGDGGADGGDAGDGGPVDGAPDQAIDMAPVDMARGYVCQNDADCVLAVRLRACEPCPVAVHVDEVLADRCVVTYIEGATLGTYTPADCWAACGEAAGEACFEAPVAPVCDPPRQAGRCTVFQ